MEASKRLRQQFEHPFHKTAGDTSTTSWASFRKEGTEFTPEYNLRPYSLFGQINLYTERRKRRFEHENKM